MERIRALNRYQKTVLLLTAGMVLVFTAVYFAISGQMGFAYHDSILYPNEAESVTVYSGEIQGIPATFRVSPDKTVDFQYGEKHYGPYTIREDPTALPKGTMPGEWIACVEVRKGEDILFRGGVSREGDFLWLYNEDGSVSGMSIETSAVSQYGTTTTYDENGKEIDPMEPSVFTIVNLAAGPELTHKGDWNAWFLGMFVCIITVVSVLFAEELFWLSISFRIQDPDRAEPSDWELAGRYIGWTVLPILALVIFFMGLQ